MNQVSPPCLKFRFWLSCLLCVTHVLGLGTPGIDNDKYPFIGYYGSRIRNFDDAGESLAIFPWTQSVAIDSTNKYWFVSTSTHEIMTATSLHGPISTFAGGAGQSGHFDGGGLNSRFNSPMGIAVDLTTTPTIYVADTGNHCVRKLSSSGTTTTIAGQPGQSGFLDGTSDLSLFNTPESLGVDITGNVYVLDAGNSYIRMIVAGSDITKTLYQGACNQHSIKQITPSLSIRLVGCHPSWIKSDGEPSGHLQTKTTGSSVCYEHYVLCGLRHHPAIRDENTKMYHLFVSAAAATSNSSSNFTNASST